MSGGEAGLVQGFDCPAGICVVFEKTDKDVGSCLSLCHKHLLFERESWSVRSAERAYEGMAFGSIPAAHALVLSYPQFL